MRTYYCEVASIDNWEKLHKVIKIEADRLEDVFPKLNEVKKEDEDIYQIAIDMKGCALPQPIYDFYNGQLFEEDYP